MTGQSYLHRASQPIESIKGPVIEKTCEGLIGLSVSRACRSDSDPRAVVEDTWIGIVDDSWVVLRPPKKRNWVAHYLLITGPVCIH